MNAGQVVQVFKCLLEAPHSRMGLAEKTGATPKAVGRLLTEMKAERMIYVISYSNANDGRNRVKIYALGDYKDAQPIQCKTQEERSRKSYAKRAIKIKQARIKTTFVGGKSLWQ